MKIRDHKLASMNTLRSQSFISVIAAIFIFLFTYTAFSKLMRFELFETVLKKSSLIASWATWIAYAIIFAEWLCVLLLLYLPFRWIGFILTSLLLIAFTIYIMIMLLSSSHLPCSCGGILKQLSWHQHFYLNIFLTALAISGLVLEKKRKRSLQIIQQT